jgi:CheY-like chemotaxis protein
MILLVEPDKTVTKRLCDLLSRERIIEVNTISQILEMLVKYKNELNVIIADISMLHEMLSSQVIFRLCRKLAIETPPIVGFYKKGNEKFKEEFVKAKGQYRLIEYNESNRSFPDQYIQLIKEVYPELNADIEKAREVWSKQEQDEELVDLHKWIEEEGLYIEEEKEIFIEDLKEKAKKERRKKEEVEERIADIEELGLLVEESEKESKTGQRKDEREDYKKMYFELKKKYDELLKYVKELTEFV